MDQLMLVLIALFARPVCCCRRGIDQWNMMHRTIMPYLLGILNVQMLVDRIIEFGRIRLGADMEYKGDRRLVFEQPFKKDLPFYQRGIFFTLQVRHLIYTAEVIHQDQVSITMLVEILYHA